MEEEKNQQPQPQPCVSPHPHPQSSSPQSRIRMMMKRIHVQSRPQNRFFRHIIGDLLSSELIPFYAPVESRSLILIWEEGGPEQQRPLQGYDRGIPGFHIRARTLSDNMSGVSPAHPNGWMLPAQHLIEQNAQRVDVRPRLSRRQPKLLRRGVPHRTSYLRVPFLKAAAYTGIYENQSI